MNVVASWTGDRADAMRQALRMTNESFAEYLGVAVRTVAYWRERPDVVPRPAVQEILDAALARASPSAQAQFALILAERRNAKAEGTSPRQTEEMPESLTAWITGSNVTDEAIENIDRAISGLAGRHTQTPARHLLADVLQVHSKTQLLLHSGRQRLRQTRDLVRIEAAP